MSELWIGTPTCKRCGCHHWPPCPLEQAEKSFNRALIDIVIARQRERLETLQSLLREARDEFDRLCGVLDEVDIELVNALTTRIDAELTREEE